MDFRGIPLMGIEVSDLLGSSSVHVHLFQLVVEDILFVLVAGDHPYVANPIIEIVSIEDHPPIQVHE